MKYTPKLNLIDTEKGIKLIKEHFEHKLAEKLNLLRVSSPKFLEAGNGLQDDLAGTQNPVSFKVKHINNQIEMVHSLAKWKRKALAQYGFIQGTGLYTDMDAIRKDEIVDEIHSNYVDQWDWEKVIRKEDRNIGYLKDVVQRIYDAIRETEEILCTEFPVFERRLPKEIVFIHAYDLEVKYPDLSPKQRELKVAEEYGAFFLIGIGGKLNSGEVHDIRAADYDDWITETSLGKRGLNGDIIVFDQTRCSHLELTSMGIRVDKDSLIMQLSEMGLQSRLDLEFHQEIIMNKLPITIGGGIGQSRLCMLLLQKFHIGEVQVSIWPEDMCRKYKERGVIFL